MPKEPFAPVLAVVEQAARDIEMASKLLAGEPLTVPSSIIEAIERLRQNAEQLVADMQTMPLHGPLAHCECGERLRLIGHDPARETWTGHCFHCWVRFTLTAAGESLDACDAGEGRPGVHLVMSERC
jgi:hypothetical protein